MSGSRSVTPERFLIVPAGERYSLTIDSPEPTQTCCIFFAPGFLEDLAGGEVELASRLETLDPALVDLAIRAWKGEGLAAQEAMVELGRFTLALADEQYRERSRLPVAREITRKDLAKRLNLARDYMLANLQEPLRLDSIAKEANIAPFHFHRLFKSSFGLTPSQFVQARRLAGAERALRSDEPVEDIALAWGYASPTAFTRAFGRQYGLSPQKYREQFRKIG